MSALVDGDSDFPVMRTEDENDSSAEAEMKVTFGGDDRELPAPEPELTFDALAKRSQHNVSQCPFDACTYMQECAHCREKRKKKKHADQSDMAMQRQTPNSGMPFNLHLLKPRTAAQSTLTAMERIARLNNRAPQAMPSAVPSPQSKKTATMSVADADAEVLRQRDQEQHQQRHRRDKDDGSDAHVRPGSTARCSRRPNTRRLCWTA